MHYKKISKNWNELRMFLPEGWIAQAKKTGALTRKREFKSAPALLRTLLIHIVNGESLKQTALKASESGIANVSSVAIFKRLKHSGNWFNWMSKQLLKKKGVTPSTPPWILPYNVKCVDGSVITEPGTNGTDWLLHFSISLFDLKADQFYLTDPSVGESFLNFHIKPNDLWLADRAYCSFRYLKYVIDREGDFIVRFKNKAFSLFQDNNTFDILTFAKKLKIGQVGDYSVQARIRQCNKPLNLRICLIPKTQEQVRKALEAYHKKAVKKGITFSKETLEMQKYIIVVTSLPENISAKKVLLLYRARWQIELIFKRMKSIVGLGSLPKKDKEACLAWLEGKLFVSILVHYIITEANFFSLWGYPLRGVSERELMGTNVIYV